MLHGYVTESGPGCNRESQCQPVLVIGSGSVRRHLVCSDHIGVKYGDVSGAGQRLRDVTNCRTAGSEPEPVVGVTKRGQR